MAARLRTLSEPVDLFPILLRAIIDENRAAASYGRSRLLEIDAYESATKFAPVAPLLTLSALALSHHEQTRASPHISVAMLLSDM